MQENICRGCSISPILKRKMREIRLYTLVLRRCKGVKISSRLVMRIAGKLNIRNTQKIQKELKRSIDLYRILAN